MTDLAYDGLLAEEYVLKRLVYVNSANHAYSEFLLDEHLAMFGRNNVGKTASLAGTKLLLFPEVNFSNCEEKFRFVGNGGTYNQEDSYEFYFPEAISFITLEVQNPEGTFCMILYKTFGYTYGRMFVPVSYDELRAVFWDTDKSQFSDDLSVKAVKQFVIENDGLQTSDPSEIRALMFEGMRGTKKQRRFCVLPMKDARPDSIEAFRNIYQLAFDIKNSEKSTLPKAIATLLEMGRGRDEERLSADLLNIADDYRELVSKQDQLQTLKNNESSFKRLLYHFNLLTDSHKEYTVIYKTLRHLLDNAKDSFEERKHQVSSATKKAIEEKTNAEKAATESNREVIKLGGKIEELENGLKYTAKRVQDTKNLYISLGFSTVDETLAALDKSFSETDSTLRAFQQEDGVRKQLASDLETLKRLQSSQRELNAYISDQSGSIAHQLDDTDSASVISSLNKNLALTVVPMTEDQIGIVKNFTALFAQENSGYLTFLDKPIKDTRYEQYDPIGSVEEARNKLDLVNKKIRELDAKIEEQRKALKSNNIEELIKKTSDELKRLSRDRDDIRSLNSMIKKHEEDENRLIALKNELTSHEIRLEKIRNSLLQLTGVASEKQQALQCINDEEKSLSRYENVFKSIQRHADIDFAIDELSQDVSLEDKWFEKLSSLSMGINSQHTNVASDLYQLLSSVQIEGVDQHRKYEALSDISKLIDRFSGEYATLQYDLEQLNTSISTHNQFVSNLISELKTSKQFLTNFIGGINEELNNKHVSNLSEINLRPEINSRFESLLATLEKQDISDETLLEPEFYQSLTRFANSYFDKKSRKLKMHDIIQAVNYEYTLEETGERVKKSQSGGTTSTITAFVLSVLLKKITPDYVALKMPIIVDEVGTLDFKNTNATIQQIAEHGFSIFCATPTFSGYISRNVGRWIMIDRAKISSPLVAKCHMHILPEHIESFGRKANAA